MNKTYRYILEPYNNGINTRYNCPNCQKRDKTFVLYIDTETGEHIHPTVGRCNRESNCGQHYTPKQYFQDNNISFEKRNFKHFAKTCKNLQHIREVEKPVSHIAVEVFKASLTAHETNHFVKFLIDLFGVEIAGELISRYFIATSKYWKGATVFWQIDTQGKIRTGKIMLYNPATGKRIKEPFSYIGWVHKAIKQPEFELKQCLFGEHLLIDKTKPVALVESEKTAVIASVYLPQFIWLAVGSLESLSAQKCSVLNGRIVTLFPDLNGFEKWNNKAKELSQLATFTVSNLMERKATEAERKQGFDLADYLIEYDYRTFILPNPAINKVNAVLQTLVEVKPFKPFEQIEPVSYFRKPEQPKPECWERDIKELEKYFEDIEIPKHPLKLNPFSTILDVSLFIESNLTTVKANNGKRSYLPYLNRLQQLKQILTTN